MKTMNILRSPLDCLSGIAILGLCHFAEAGDCNWNGIEDAEETSAGLVDDCNSNSLPDSCDIAAFYGIAYAANYGVPESAFTVALLDTDSDGDLDMAVGAGTDNVTFFVNQGGNYVQGDNVRVGGGSSPRYIEAADMDGDGALDLVVSVLTEISILVQEGTGSFAPLDTVPSSGETAITLVTVDLDEDGDEDLVGANTFHGSISIYRNAGGAMFDPALRIEMEQPLTVAPADFDGDRRTDLAVGSRSGTYLLRNSGEAAFEEPLPIHTGSALVYVTAADVEGDGDVDLVSSGHDTGTFIVSHNDGGSFPLPPDTYDSAEGMVRSADMNEDGFPDIIALAYRGILTVLPNDGQGSFPDAGAYIAGPDPTALEAGDIDGDGDLDIVSTRSPGAASNSVLVFRNLGNGELSSPRALEMEIGARGVSSGDLNGDGALDLIVSGLPTIFTSVGGGRFARWLDLPTGEGPRASVPADFDRDGDLDFAVANGSDSFCTLFRNDGDGEFPSRTLEVGGDQSAVAASDLDGDGAVDLALGISSHGLAVVAFNGGDGSFPSTESFPVSATPLALVTEDLDGDTDGDIAILSLNYTLAEHNGVRLLLNDGNRDFVARDPIPLVGTPSGAVAGDLDRDGDSDLAVTLTGYDKVSVLTNVGGGEYAFGPEVAVGRDPSAIVAVDLDDDGVLELAVTEEFSHSLSILIDGGSGKLLRLYETTVGERPTSLTAGDFDGDEDPDLIAVSLEGAASVILTGQIGRGSSRDCNENGLPDECELEGRDCNGNGWLDECDVHPQAIAFEPSIRMGFPFTPQALVHGDVDQDSDEDLLISISEQNYRRLAVLGNDGNGIFSKTEEHNLEANTNSLSAGDFDSDGDLDVAVALHSIDAIAVYRNEGAGSFAHAFNFPVGRLPAVVVAADLDDDGSPDLVSTNNDEASISVLRNLGDGTFAAAENHAVGSRPYDLETADLDGDDDTDLVVSCVNANQIDILLNDGLGGFWKGVPFRTRSTPLEIAIIDFDGNTRPDLAIAVAFEAMISVYENRENATFTLLRDMSLVGGGIGSLVAADMDFDGQMDLLGAASAVKYLQGDGRGAFTQTVVHSNGYTRAIVPFDFDGDEDLDIAFLRPESYAGRLLGVKNTMTRRQSLDCNDNGVPDECDVAAGTSRDDDGDGCLDECCRRLVVPKFHRGDSNQDGVSDISDALNVLGVLFLGGSGFDCQESADMNNDAEIDITDPVFLLGFLFLGGASPPSPGTTMFPCGRDPDVWSSEQDLGCQSYEACTP